MKKIIITIGVLIVLGFLGYFIYVNYINKVPKITPEPEKVSVEEYYMYGNHFNIKGTLELSDKSYEDIKLTLYNGEDKDFDIEVDSEDNKINFYTSEEINEGLYLDDIPRDTYYLFLKLTYKNEENKEEPIVKYYVLDNKTEYKESTYYTLSKYNNKILINSNNDYKTMMFNIIESKDKDIYDITIDPGHGGMDGGGASGDYKETDFTMDISKKIKENLEKKNIKVKLTHDEGDLTKNEVMDEYNKHGRAVIPNEVKSKYTFSIHINRSTSSKVRGIEIYTAKGINYDLAKSLADNITSYTDLEYSSNKLYKEFNGIYTHNFTAKEIESSLKGYDEKGYKPYNVTEKSNYLYMIRETGGYLTGAYVDDSNPDKVGVNPYYKNNIANESYLLELGYLSNQSDLDILIKSQDKLANAISDAIIKELGL